ncbi:MAG: hypothetical protein ACYC8T_24415 [Myxococcaceae bacterium]
MFTELRLHIASSCFRVELPRSPEAAGLSQAYAPFSTREEAVTTIEVEHEGTLPDGPWFMPEVRRHPDGAMTLSGPGFEANATPDRRRVRLRQGPGRFPLDSVLKVLIAERLLERGGLLLHSVALAHGGRAACFSGSSGAGKSTLGSLGVSGGLSLLADELVAVVPAEGGYTAIGTPWNIGSPAGAKLVAIGSLSWAAASTLEPAPASELLRLLLPNTVMPDPSAEGRARLFRAASALLSQVPVVKLAFARDPSAALAIRSRLEQG